MVHIEELPVEVLSQIMGHLVDPEDHNPSKLPGLDALNKDDGEDETHKDEMEDIRNACLVSRKFCDIAQPLIFRDFEDLDLDGDLRNTIAFAKAIYGRPELGNYVQSIGFMPIIPEEANFRAQAGIGPEYSEFLHGLIKDLQLGDQEKSWVQILKNCDLGIIGALLVNKTPNLRDLHLPAGQFSIKPIVDLISRDPSLLSNLESFWVESDVEDAGWDIATFEKLLTSPHLIHPTFEYGNLLDKSFPSTWKPQTLSAQELVFHHCHIDGGAIQKFMKACKKVKSLIVQNFSVDPQDGRPPTKGMTQFDAAQGLKAALLHKNTLEHFHLEYDEYSAKRPKIGSFRDFTALDMIFISHSIVPPHPTFCRSLKELHFTDCNTSVREVVKNIAADCKKGLYPEFTKFRVLSRDITAPIKLPGQRVPQGQTPEQCFRSIQDMFKGTKVDFQIVPYEMPDFDDYDSDTEDYEDDEEYPPGLAGLLGGLRGPGGGGGTGRGPMPPQLLDMIMQRAMQDPEFAHLAPRGGDNDDEWMTDGED
ncbi:hypothetical protein N7448_010673 [Penicillium atrosanguineum]|uniref:mitogen-activated protein kinase Hog1 n=1 Tax=Penicillium atrosanguineum TaxID=1132637 RepID=UPI0023858FF8|nr:mitogen-activated protein kinase Hog1 [Penicillium atrosanguineum]KAJ5120004.1 hypothetical protein N7448_010673 [Penicillium atrosanguineum]KAJ5297002.1 mitogen-activated protein kinase Hog1 [Penicillium atrosanguineum]